MMGHQSKKYRSVGDCGRSRKEKDANENGQDRGRRLPRFMNEKVGGKRDVLALQIEEKKRWSQKMRKYSCPMYIVCKTQ